MIHRPHIRAMLDDIKFYIVVNDDNQFHMRGPTYAGYVNGRTDEYSWTDNINKAKIFKKIGTARGAVTTWAEYYNSRGDAHSIPTIIEFNVGSFTLLDQTERIAKQRKAHKAAVEKWEKEEAERQQQAKHNRIQQLESELRRLKSDT